MEGIEGIEKKYHKLEQALKKEREIADCLKEINSYEDPSGIRLERLSEPATYTYLPAISVERCMNKIKDVLEYEHESTKVTIRQIASQIK